MRDRPHPNHKLEWPGGVVPEWARPQQNGKKRFGKQRGGKGGGPERQGGSSPGKRERLQKVMAQSGHGSRRNIEILIAQGHITINGQVAKLGDSVGPGDKVKLDGNIINLRFGEQLPRVLLYHKPEGEIVSRDDPEKRATVFDRLPKVNGGRWVSVGRLDLNTGGLLLFTTNGELANRLTHPRFEVEREYAVRVMGELTPELGEKLLKTGVDIEGENCTFDSIEDRGGEGSNHWYHVVLREGKNREVRKMFEAVGLMVSRLMRVRFGPITLPGHVKRGMVREMEEEQVQELLAFSGMNESPEAEARSEEEDDELENIGNRIQDHREPKVREIDDDIGNKVNARQQAAEPPEVDGNRGTYNPNAGEAPPKGTRRPQGKPFFKKGGQGQRSHGQGAPHHQGQGHGQGQQHGQGQGHGQGHGKPHGQGQGRHRHRDKQGQPKDGNVAPGGPPPVQGQGQGPGGQQPQGNGPKRNRRHKNRNRNRGAGAATEGRGDQQPQQNGNREP
jgi:23S rRNA pseudouridine2605 synthase